MTLLTVLGVANLLLLTVGFLWFRQRILRLGEAFQEAKVSHLVIQAETDLTRGEVCKTSKAMQVVLERTEEMKRRVTTEQPIKETVAAVSGAGYPTIVSPVPEVAPLNQSTSDGVS